MTETTPNHILIAGYYGFGNTGDETILTALLADLRRNRSDLMITVVSGNPAETAVQHRVQSVLWTDTLRIFEVVKSCDLVIVGGGGIFHDQFGFKEEYLLTKNHAGIAYFAGYSALAAMYQKPLMLYAIGIGPLISEPGERLTKNSLAAANIVTLRDAASLAWAEKAGVIGSNLQVTADPAFLLEADLTRAQKILYNATLPRRKGAPLIAVCPRYWDINVSLDQWQVALAEALDRFVEEVDGELLFIPFQNLEVAPDVNDTAVAVSLRGLMKHQDRATILNKSYSPDVIAGLIASCDMLVGMRLHSLVFGILGGVPLVGLSYDPKVRHLLNRVGLDSACLELKGLSAARLHSALKIAWGEKDRSVLQLAKVLPDLKKEAEENTRLVFQLLDGQTPALRHNLDEDFIWRLAEKQTLTLAEHEEKVRALERQIWVLREQTNIPLRIRRWLFPAASKRDTALRILRHEGATSLFKRGYEKILRSLRKPAPAPMVSVGRADIRPAAGKPDVLCFSVINWDFRFQRPQQLLTQYARDGHRVFYLRITFNGGMEAGIRLLGDNIYEICLPGDEATIIYYHEMSEDTLRRSFTALRRLIRDEGWSNAICLVHHPFWTPLVRRVKTEYGWRVIYDCMDDHSGFQVTHPEFEARERELISTSDLVVTTSKLLFERMQKLHQNCTLIPNAGDFEHFHHLPPRATSPLADLPAPVIGYYGAIAEWFDVEAIQQAALKHPDWSFVLLGHLTRVDLRGLKNLSNVHFLGEKKYAELPAYLSGFDVCTIPFLRLPLTEATNPVKVFEYLSSGKPVVATALPELLPLQEVVALYSNPAEFTAQLEETLQSDSVSLREQRIAISRANTWHDRYLALQSRTSELFARATIIVVAWNNLEHTRRCVESVLADMTWPNFELVIVDNASTDETPAYLRDLVSQNSNVRVIMNEHNLGFAAANNIALQQALHSEYIILLNNDTVVPVGWLARLIGYLRDPAIGMVGPVTNAAGNEARIEVPYGNLEEMHTFARAQVALHDGESFDIGMLAMYCVALRRAVVDEVGLLDESFGIGMFEDDDYARRVRQKGYRIVCAEDVFVHHAGRVSFSRLESNEYRQLFEKNRSLFEAKWGTEWVPHKRSKTGQTLL